MAISGTLINSKNFVLTTEPLYSDSQSKNMVLYGSLNFDDFFVLTTEPL